MHAWIGFVFSCVMILIAAAGKSGYQLLPASIGSAPDLEFMFFIGCAGVAAALSLLAPSHSSARLASMWSASALAAVVVALNLTGLTGNGKERIIESETAVQLPSTTKEGATAGEEPRVNVTLKRTVTDPDWAPFQDIDYRIKMMERQMEPQPANSEANPANIPPIQ